MLFMWTGNQLETALQIIVFYHHVINNKPTIKKRRWRSRLCRVQIVVANPLLQSLLQILFNRHRRPPLPSCRLDLLSKIKKNSSEDFDAARL
ncbi:unnamed protein product [Linum trigynum]|uniref:Uncharacterized protein n=1 Tax=Linum trigynum TaxID=586398 RepID=A0AAV2DRT8_9ROSI